MSNSEKMKEYMRAGLTREQAWERICTERDAAVPASAREANERVTRAGRVKRYA